MQNAKVLLLDVINFVNNVDLARIDHCLQVATGVRRPFGGLSVIVFGDFHQLPPPRGDWIFEDLSKPFIEKQLEVIPNSLKLWNLFRIVELPELNYRVTDSTQRMVSRYMRHGNHQEGLCYDLKEVCFICLDMDQTKEEIVEHYQLLTHVTGSKNIAVLVPSNDIVDDINFSLVSRRRKFPPIYSAGLERCYNWHAALKDVYVASGSPVVCAVNYNEKIRNGSMTRVVDFYDETIVVTFSTDTIELHRVPFQEGNRTFLQFPLRLGYAHTIERAQGATFDGIFLVRNETWNQEEEIYAALSRARDLRKCQISPMSFLGLNVFSKVEKEINRMRRDCRELID